MEITIKALENLTSAAKSFLEKVLTPPLEETGLLLADKIKLWRFKNQITILADAENYLKEKNIKTRKVSLKILTPLLEGASLEDDETLQYQWACLIANTVRENSKINTTLYPYILSQLSNVEAELLHAVFHYSTVTDYGDPNKKTYREDSNVNGEIIHKLKPSLQYEESNIDNLIRLRLIKELNPEDLSLNDFTLTSLGFDFSLACEI